MMERQWTIIEGDVKDLEAVRKALQPRGADVDTIVSGIGGTPAPQLSLFRPLTMTDPTICSDAVDTILAALAQTQSKKSPLLVVISANGVRGDLPRDYPLMLTPLYRWMLTGVFDDKRRMEATLERTLPPGGYVIVRPSTLADGESKGVSAVREGLSDAPVLGFNINRSDVGLWIYEKLIDTETRESFMNRGVCITY